MYDAFISYRHSKSQIDIARALQRGLHTLAKPWYRMRALHLYRDETNLSAEPNMWETIKRALDNSRYLILLASPKAASSEWVRKELEYWYRTKDNAASHLIVLLTEGCLSWDDHSGRFDPDRTTALPRDVLHLFAAEPRYVDMKWARTGSRELTLRDPRFLADVASIAAPLHGRSMDELVGEDLRQHRNSRRVIWATSIVVSGLLASVLAVTVQSNRNYRSYLQTDSTRFAVESQRMLDTGQPDTALLLARKGLISPNANGQDDLRSYYSKVATRVLARASATFPIAVRTINYPTGIQFATFSPDGTKILVLREDGLAELRTAAGDQIRAWSAHTDQPHGGAFSPDGKLILTTAEDGFANLWNTETGNLIHKISVGSPVITGEFDKKGDRLLTASKDGQARTWSVQSGSLLNVAACDEKKSNTALLNSASFSPDGRLIALGCDGGAEIHDNEGKFLHALAGGCTKPVGVAFSPNGAALAASDDDGSVCLWNTEGRLLRILPGSGNRTKTVVFNSDGSKILTASDDGTARIWNAAQGVEEHVLRGYSFYVLSAGFSPDGKSVVTASWDKTVKIWSLENKELGERQFFGDSIASLEVSHDSAVVGTWNAGTFLWDLRSGGQMEPLPLENDRSVTSAAFSPDGSLVALGSVKEQLMGGQVTILDSRTRVQVAASPVAEDGIADLKFDQAGKQIVIGYDDGMVEFRRVPKLDLVCALPVQSDGIDAIDLGDDNELVVAVSGEISLWNSDCTSRGIKFPSIGTLSSVAFNPDQSEILAATYLGKIVVYDARTGRLLREVDAGADEAETSAPRLKMAKFSPQGTEIAASYNDGSVLLLDARSGDPIEMFMNSNPTWTKDWGHLTTKAAAAIAFMPDGNQLVVGFGDGTVQVWTPTSHSLAELIANSGRAVTSTK
ncbi:TIR domain-containing protein [Mesorhizobium sp.]|uniref:TIR domain-containing protein n=1 Tax=Mesorhizobium sp. TaxID=1871066 RepID=UPI000FE7A818|nr:TIR domain-containing protein [Mesorhizobium sp.]RWE79575.1 MAG: TIR domain-containing protein [Mesorhizobium sp.]